MVSMAGAVSDKVSFPSIPGLAIKPRMGCHFATGTLCRMTTRNPPTAATRAIVAHTALSRSAQRWIFLYLGTLVFLLAFGSPASGLIDIPFSFFLKNKLHLPAQELADFRLVAAIPVYLSFVFGFIRDVWNPFGMKDRGFMLLFGGITAALYVLFVAFTPVSTGTLLVAIIVLMTSYLFVASAQNGLASSIGQQHAISGQISAVWNIFSSIPNIAAFLLGGSLSSLLERKNAEQTVHIIFLIGAAIMALVAAYAALRPRSVFDNLRNERTATVEPLKDIRRLIRHWPIYPALLIWTLWNFSPGAETPLQYYLQNTLNGGDANWGQFNAIAEASYILTFIVFGLLCRKYPLKNLLLWGTVIAVPQMVPLLLVHSATDALIAAMVMGLMGGIATAAYIDLIIRSCPAGLQGTILMTSAALSAIVSRFGDVLGTFLYEEYGGFGTCVVMITVVYALILPALLLIPKDLIVTADGQKLQIVDQAKG
ncbi:MAG: MFS transporter [Pseudolabrys sp.]